MKKLVKLSDTHYIVVDDPETPPKDYQGFYFVHGKIFNTNKTMLQTGCKKITHSTQPLEGNSTENICCDCKGNITDKGVCFCNQEVGYIPLAEVEEAIYGYNVEKMGENYYNTLGGLGTEYDKTTSINLIIWGFKAHQELVKDKLFTVEDMRKAIQMAWEADSIDGTVDLNVVLHYGNNNDLRTKWSEEEIIQSLLPKTEWDIEFIDGKIKLL